MKISFTTLGCPDWDLDTICRRGREYGYEGVDFRGLQETMDVTQLPAFTSGAAQTRRQLADAGMEVSGISSSIRVCVPEKLEENVEEARRSIPVANALGCGSIRVFGGGDSKTYSKEQLADIGRETMEQILALDGAGELRWLFETHDEWIKSVECKLLLDRIPNEAFGVLWDMGHTARVGEESPEQTYQAVGPRIGYTHVKDAVYDPEHAEAMRDGWRYVPPGAGQLPLEEAIALLKGHGYDGWLMFEHEKRWHPELAEPRGDIPDFSDLGQTVARLVGPCSYTIPRSPCTCRPCSCRGRTFPSKRGRSLPATSTLRSPNTGRKCGGLSGIDSSTLQLIFPEAYLGETCREQTIAGINQRMQAYLKSGVLAEQRPGFMLIEREVGRAVPRKGLVVALDLEQYDYRDGAQKLIRTTEGTDQSRLPPRIQVREKASLEIAAHHGADRRSAADGD